MDPEAQTIDLREYLKILRRRKGIIILTFLTVLAATAAVTWRMTPIYEGLARVEVQPVSATSSDVSRLLEALIEPSRALQTQVELIKSEVVLDKAAESLGLPSIEQLEENLKVELIRDTQIVEIRVRHERPDEARDWTNAVAEAYIDYRRERAVEQTVLASEEMSRQIEVVKGEIAERDRVLADLDGASAGAKEDKDGFAAQLAGAEAELRTAPPESAPALTRRIQSLRLRISELDRTIQDYESGGSQPRSEREQLVARMSALESQRQELPGAEALRQGGGTIVMAAQTPDSPVLPKPLLNMALAVVLGAMLAIGLAFLAENLDDRIRSPEEVEERVRAPVLGYVPHVVEWDRDDAFLAALQEPSSGASEAYRTLRTNLKFISIENPLGTILITSAVASEGKSTTAANLAVVQAQGGSRTVLLSGDLRRPSLHKFFDLPDTKGVLDALDNRVPLEETLQSNGVDNFRLLSAGGLPPNPTEILGSSRFGELLLRLSQASDLVLIDAPPVLGLADTGALASKVDGVLMVVDTHQATRRNLAHAADQIRKAGGKIIGAVMNSVEPEEGYGYYYQYYYYQYAKDGKKDRAKAQPAEEVGSPS